MKNYCKNHPNKIALSFCCICKNYYCKECLIEGKEYYYCYQANCYNEYLKERKKILESYESNPRFCPKCLEETSKEATGNLDVTNFIGTTISTVGGHCNICNSLIAEKRFILFGIPIKSYGYYRIIELKRYGFVSSEITFLSRKLKNQNINLISLNNFR